MLSLIKGQRLIIYAIFLLVAAFFISAEPIASNGSFDWEYFLKMSCVSVLVIIIGIIEIVIVKKRRKNIEQEKIDNEQRH